MQYIVLLLALILLTACGSDSKPMVAPEATASPLAMHVATSVPSSPTATPSPLPSPTATPSPLPSPTATPSPTPSLVVVAAPPTRLQIAAIDLDQEIISVGLDEQRVPIVPNHEVGWYNLSARLGQRDNIVLWGHVLRFRSAPNIPAPFARIKDLEIGDTIMLSDAKGAVRHYVIARQVWVTPDQVEYIMPQGREMVTLVSCIGDKVVDESGVEMSHRLITIAELVGE
ncbi:sortase domain-bontaining protein [Candidatus Oscillochloris fontis]|uniref:sortase domain-containing protein n=1 Tax=Candidatus Oscillochloris fontis TaxID=2496868 RepID=UPI00101C4E1D|nr:sortase [Candidatus Oscillochloris fontis]